MLLQNFLHGEQHNALAAPAEERIRLAHGIVGVIERHEETFLAILAHHHGFKGINVGTTDFVLLFDLGMKIAQPFMAGLNVINIKLVPSGTKEFQSNISAL